ncbi:hypothetical protein [Micromonospora endophytica]|uniref:hypothetical protein n=1 Tax=Micromonospora endophytica TaxID=515350 RepID=UPI0011B74437|nr:hypothetical protein [Micromonospora endophytica]BCJ61702.1 hypothetical protein Jiend_51240 [Micromonospora endophytica]
MVKAISRRDAALATVPPRIGCTDGLSVVAAGALNAGSTVSWRTTRWVTWRDRRDRSSLSHLTVMDVLAESSGDVDNG